METEPKINQKAILTLNLLKNNSGKFCCACEKKFLPFNRDFLLFKKNNFYQFSAQNSTSFNIFLRIFICDVQKLTNTNFWYNNVKMLITTAAGGKNSGSNRGKTRDCRNSKIIKKVKKRIKNWLQNSKK